MRKKLQDTFQTRASESSDASDLSSSADELPGLDFDKPDSSSGGDPLTIPEQIGRYFPVKILGEGGMGTVYLAEQKEPIQRNVALKVIKSDRNSRQVISRFEAERQALALMNHPNIAKVLDGGITTAGLPFFVMELVDGERLNEFCDQQQLPLGARLRLFCEVCRGVEHAHQKGVIHRDLKPSNILVSRDGEEPRPKIIDFGLAKATADSQFDETALTQVGQMLGTVQYMSPEQAELGSKDIDTRTDVYSLGIILYELITGVTPLTQNEIASRSILEVLKQIQSGTPTRPSSKIQTADESQRQLFLNRNTNPSRLKKAVQGDLETIVMKALETDRDRRYASVNEFANDIERFLSNEPILARRPSFSYRVQKLVQRNLLAFSFAASLAATLVIATGLSAYLAVQARRSSVESDRAKRRALNSLAAVQNFVLESPVWKNADPGRDSLIKLLTEEYRFWSTEDQLNRRADIPAMTSAMVRLAALEKEVGRLDQAKRLANDAKEILSSSKLDSDNVEIQIASLEVESLLTQLSDLKGEALNPSLDAFESSLRQIRIPDLDRRQTIRVASVRQSISDYCYHQESRRTLSMAIANHEFFAAMEEQYPDEREFTLLKARSLSRWALARYKGRFYKEREGNPSREEVHQLYQTAIKIADRLIEIDYKTYETSRHLAGFISNEGMLYLRDFHQGECDFDAVLAHYDKGIAVADEQLEAYPKNLLFMEIKGLLLNNKSDALRAGLDFSAEEAARLEARDLFLHVTEAVSTDGIAGARRALNLARLVTNQCLQFKMDEAIRYCRELEPFSDRMNNDSGFERWVALRLMAEDPTLTSEKRKSYDMLACELFSKTMRSDAVLVEYFWEFITTNEAVAAFRDESKYQADWETARRKRSETEQRY